MTTREETGAILGARIDDLNRELNATQRKARMIDLGAQIRAVEDVWDLLAIAGVASERPRPPGPCDEHCEIDGHYLSIRHPDGSMHHTVHVDGAVIEGHNDTGNEDALEDYRYRARRSLLRIEPPDRPAPCRVGHYVITPPADARVSAPSIVEITEDDRGQAWAQFHRAAAVR